MRVTVFGATGRMGRAVLPLLRAKGHLVRAVCRQPGQLAAEPPGLEVVVADLGREEEVARALEGGEAVICAFGPARVADPPFCAELTHRILQAMQQQGVRRLLCVTGAMVGEYAHRSAFSQAMVYLFRRSAPEQARDREEQERLVMESRLEWTVVKPPRLTEGPPQGRVRAGESEAIGLRSYVSRADLAAFLAEQLASPGYVGRRIVVQH